MVAGGTIIASGSVLIEVWRAGDSTGDWIMGVGTTTDNKGCVVCKALSSRRPSVVVVVVVVVALVLFIGMPFVLLLLVLLLQEE